MIHSLISQTRARILPGSYQLARRLAQESLDSMLHIGDNADVLLAIHSSDTTTTIADMHGIVCGAEEYQHNTLQHQYFEHAHESHESAKPLSCSRDFA